MNKIYRAIWNESTQTWVAASELAKSKTKANTVSCQTAVMPSLLSKFGFRAFKAGLIASLVNMTLFSPELYAAASYRIHYMGNHNDSTYPSSSAASPTNVSNHNSGSRSTITLSGEVANCGADYVKGRSNITKEAGSIDAWTEYKRFATNTSFVYNGVTYTPYGTLDHAEWGLSSGTLQQTYDPKNSTAKTAAGQQGQITTNIRGIYKLPLAYGVGSFAAFCGSYTEGNYSTAFGTNATVLGGGAQAFGNASLAQGRASNAVGVSSQASGVSSVALGSVANANGVGTVAIGLQSQAAGDGAVAIGAQSQTGLDSGIAIGNNDSATFKQSIGIGSGNDVRGEGAIAIGGASTATTYNTDDGLQNESRTGNTTILGNNTISLGNSNTGKTFTSKKDDGISAANTTVFGNSNTINNAIDGVHIIGNSNTVGAANSASTGTGATVIGNNSIVSSDNGMALGNNITVGGTEAIAVGNKAQALADGAVALGSGSIASTAGGVAGYNPDSSKSSDDPIWKSTTGAVAVGNSDKNTRQITDVAAGVQETDAVNVAQLKSLYSSVSGSVDNLSAGIQPDLGKMDGNVASLSTSLDDKLNKINTSISTVSEQTNTRLNTLDQNISDLTKSTSEGITSLQQNTLKYNKNLSAYNVGSEDGRTTYKIINVAEGQVAADSTDMVNAGQLYTTNAQLTSISTGILTGIGTLNSGADGISSAVDKSVPKINADMDGFTSFVATGINELRSNILEWDEKGKKFDAKDEKKITGVEKGSADSPDSTDAVTGAQLRATNMLVNKVAVELGNSITNNNNQVNKLILNTNLAISDSKDRLTTLNTSVSTGLSRITRNALLFDAQADGGKGAYQADLNKTPQKISNAAEGDISEKSTDAITGGQLYTTNSNLATLSTSISAGLTTIAGNRNSISTAAKNRLDNLSTTISGSLSSLSTVITSDLKTLSNNLQAVSSSSSTAINNLQNSTILQGKDEAFHATHENRAQKITSIAPAELSPDSTDMVNGKQLYTTNSNISSLASTVNSSFSSLSDSLSASVGKNLNNLSTALSTTSKKVSDQQNAELQWDDDAKAFSAKHGIDGNQTITQVSAGDISDPNSTDAVTGGQYYKLSKDIDTEINNQTTSALNSIGRVNESISTLQHEILQFTDGSFNAQRVEKDQKITGVAQAEINSASTEAVTGAQLYSTNLSLKALESSISTGSADFAKLITQYSESTMQSGINRVNELNTSIGALQSNALQWDDKERAYSATHGIKGNQKITNVTAGYIGAGSTDAIVGSQYYDFSLSTAKSVEKLNNELNGLSLDQIKQLTDHINKGLETTNKGIAQLKQDALQWNGDAYDASHGSVNGKEQITHVAEGNLLSGSTDAVTGSQLFKTNNSIDSLNTSFSAQLKQSSDNIDSLMAARKDELSKNVHSGISKLADDISTDIQTINTGISGLKENALLWNGSSYDASHGKVGALNKIINAGKGGVYDKSSDAVIGDQLFSTNKNVSALSGRLDTELSDFSNSFSTNLLKVSSDLNQTMTTGFDSLSTTINTELGTINTSQSAIKQKALKWNDSVYDAIDENDNKGRITQVAKGDLQVNSSDAVVGAQLFSTDSRINLLSESFTKSVTDFISTTSGSLQSLSTVLDTSSFPGLDKLSTETELRLNDINDRIPALQQNALQWNKDKGAYDASHGDPGSKGKITNVADGLLAKGSKDAVTGNQLFNTNKAISDLGKEVDAGVNSLSESLLNISDKNIATLTGLLKQTNSKLISLSTTTQTEFTSTNTGISDLLDNALQWTDKGYDVSHKVEGAKNIITHVAAGSLKEGSSDAVTGAQLFSTNSSITALESKLTGVSNSLSTGINSLSSSLSDVIDSNLSKLAQNRENIESGIDSLSTSVSSTVDVADKDLADLKQNALQWKDGSYDASHGIENAKYRITHVGKGDIYAGSTDAITGGQLHTTNSNISALTNRFSTSFESFSTTLNGLVDAGIGSLSTGIDDINTNVTILQQNALQWNAGINAYDASVVTGNPAKITQVAAGQVGLNSSDAITGAQLYSLSTASIENLNHVSISMSKSLSTINDSAKNVSDLLTKQFDTISADISDNLNSLSKSASTNQNTFSDNAFSSISSLSSSTSDRLTELSGDIVRSINTLSDNANTGLISLATSITDSAGQLSKSLSDIKGNADKLKQDALQWNEYAGAYSANHGIGESQFITNVAAGTVAPDSTDAVNGTQLYNLSTGIQDADSIRYNSVSSVLNDNITKFKNKLDDTTTTTANSLNNLSDSLTNITTNMTSLQTNALLWNGSAYDAGRNSAAQRITNVAAGNIALDSTDAVNGGQLFRLSSSTSTGLNSLSTNLNTVTDNQLGSLSTIISNSLSTVNQNVSSLSTGLNTVTEKVTALQTDTLQWDKVNGNYKADHGEGRAQKITQVAAGSIAANSTDAVNGAQMYSLSTGTADSVNKLTENLNKTNSDLGTLSTATKTDLNNLTNSLSSTSDELTKLSSSTSGSIQSISTSLDTLTTSTANSLQALDKGLQDTSSSVSALQTNALQWNADKGVYDASRNGSAKVLSGVAAGAVSAVSTEAVNGGQLYSLSTVTVAGLNSVSTGLNSLSQSATTGLNNLSASLSSTNQNLTTLQQNALQWNSTLTAYDASHNGTAQRITNVAAGRIAADSTDAVNGSQFFNLSSSASTGLNSLSTSLSTVTNDQLSSLSTITGDNLNTVNKNVTSLSTSLDKTNINVAELRQNALQWNGVSSAYDATRSGRAQKLTGIAGGDISPTSSDAVNGAQMYSLSTLTQKGLGSISTGLSSLSSVTSSSLDNVNRSLESLSTVTHTGLNSVSTGLSNLSESTTTGLNNLTNSLSSTNQNLTTLQQNALQWNSTLTAYDASHNGTAQRITNVAAGRIAADSTDAVNGSQFFNLSSSASTGLNSLSTSLSTVTNDQLSSLSTITGDNLNTVNKNVTSLSTSLDKTNINVAELRQNALQWNGVSSAYDATRSGRAQKLTGIAGGDISPTSSDAVNGAQMYSLSTLTQKGLGSISTGLSSLSSVTSSSLDNVNRSLESLSTVTHTGLNSVSTGLNSLSQSASTGLNNLTNSLNSTNQNLTTLQQNTLQWNSTRNAYDAGHNGTAQRITNVAAGNIATDSTDAVNGDQLFSLSGSTSTGLSSLSTVVSSTVINEISTISSSLSTGYESLSHSLSTATDNLQQLTNITSSSLSSLSTVTSTTQKDVSDLKEKALKWNDDKGGFDAGRPNNLTRDLGLGKIYNVEDGLVEAGSHEAVTGGQLYTVQSDLIVLSESTSKSLNSLDKTLDELSTSNVITNVANLTKNALQWKDDGTSNNTGFYDAGYNGTAQRITNIAAGNIAQGSLDAVNAGQLWTVQSSLSTLSTKVGGLPTGNVSDAELASLSTAISTGIANQISTAASSLGTSYQPSKNSIEPPKYDSITPTGGVVSADNVDDALANLRNYGTKFVKSNSAKATSVAQGADSIAVGGAAMASGTSAVAIGDSASAPLTDAVALGSQAKVTQAGGVALGAGSVANTAAGIESYIPVTATSQQAAAIRATKSTEGAVSVGDASKDIYRQITGVAAGTADTDAVNVAQLKGVDNQVSRINEYVNQLNDNVHRVERRAYSGTAMAMALSGAYLPSLNGGEQTVGVGVGAYRGYGAIGVNYKAASKNGKITWGAGVSTTGKEVAVNSVLGFKW